MSGAVDERYYYVVNGRIFELRKHFVTAVPVIWILYEERSQHAAELIFANASAIRSEGGFESVFAYTDTSGAQTPDEVAEIVLGVEPP